MSTFSPGKTRFVINDTEMLCALEVHVPSIRSLHSGITPLMRIVADWESEEIAAIDSRLQRNFKADKQSIIQSFSNAAISRSQAKRLDDCEFTTDVDLYTILEMNWAMHMLWRSTQDIQTGYEHIYNVLAARIAGRQPQCAELDELHFYYGALTQARLKLGSKLSEVNGTLTRLADGGHGMLKITESALEAYASCTDVRDYLMMLKDAHQRGFEFARRPH